MAGSNYFTPGLGTSLGFLEQEKDKVAARESVGMPKATAASMTGAPMTSEGASRQVGLAERLKATATGTGGPTAGQSTMYANNDAAKRAMMASAFGKPGGAAGMRAARTTGNQAAYMDAATARQADIIGAQEQQAAMAQYGQLGAAMRSADIANADEYNRINMANAGFQQSAAMANQDAALRWQQMDDAQKRMLLAQGIDAAQNDFDAGMAYKSAMNARDMAAEQWKKDQDANTRAQQAQALSQVASVLALGMSDERAKTDVRDGDADLREFLDAVGAYSYRYKNPNAPGAAPGRHVSPMAQEIEGTTVGRSAVVEGEDGRKRVDYARLLGAIVAAEGHLNKRLSKLEGRG